MSNTNKIVSENRSVASRFKPSMVIWPILFGLIGVGYMLWREMHDDIPQGPITLADHWWVFALLVVLFTLLKDFSGMYRLRVMSGAPLKFSQLFRIRMLYEFTSAVTPSAAGGSSLEVIFIHREGIKVSRATSMTILALFLDEMFMIVLFPVLLMLIPYGEMFTADGYFQYGYLWAFIIGYVMKFVWVTMLFIGLFCKSIILVKIIGAVFSLKFLRRYRYRALRTADRRQLTVAVGEENVILVVRRSVLLLSGHTVPSGIQRRAISAVVFTYIIKCTDFAVKPSRRRVFSEIFRGKSSRHT